MHFPATGTVGTNVDGFLPSNGSQGNDGAPFDARDRERLGVISYTQDLDNNEDDSLGETPNTHPDAGLQISPEASKLGNSSVQTTAGSVASTSPGAIIEELQ